MMSKDGHPAAGAAGEDVDDQPEGSAADLTQDEPEEQRAYRMIQPDTAVLEHEGFYGGADEDAEPGGRGHVGGADGEAERMQRPPQEVVVEELMFTTGRNHAL